jgi:four helix bundle protein
MAKGDDILERLLRYSVSVVRICESVPKTHSATHIAGQPLRCGTSAAPNYAEARSGESARDFIHKLGIALKELNESTVQLETPHRLGLVEQQITGPMKDECSQLCKILAASIKTASGRITSKP